MIVGEHIRTPTSTYQNIKKDVYRFIVAKCETLVEDGRQRQQIADSR
jgi:hypothetical protein